MNEKGENSMNRKRKKVLTLVTILSTMLPYASVLETQAFAGTVDNLSQSAAVTIPTTITKDDYLNYFHLNGSATGKFDPNTGKQILTDSNHQSGNITFQAAIDLRGSFTINSAINIGKSNGQTAGTGAIADGIAFAFYKGQRDQVGGTGGNLGIYGIPNAFGWKLDTFTNVGKQDSLKGDPDRYYDSNTYYDHTAPYGGFISTDKTGYGTLDESSYKGFSYAEIADGKYHNLKIAYDGMTHDLTVTLDLINGKQVQFSKKIDFDPNDPAYYFTLASSTGDTPLIQGFEFDSMTYKSIQKAIISYVDDTTGKEVKNDSVLGKAGDLINYSTNDTIQELEKQGYVLLNDTFKPSATFDNDELTDQTYQVHLIETGKIQANYLDEATNEPIADSISQTGRVNDPYSTSPVSPAGYALDIEKLPANRNGKITRDTQTVNYYYKKIDNSQVENGKVITKYVDEQGTEIEGVPAQTQTGRVGDSYTTNAQYITGYALDSTKLPENATGTFDQEEKTVTYVYQKADKQSEENGTVLIKHEDTEGNPIAGVPDETKTGRVGDSYATNARMIDGYDLDKTDLPTNAQGTFQKENQTVIYKYVLAESEVAKNGTITTKFEDENGAPITGISDEIQTGRVGDSYATNARVIDGYALDVDALPANATGKFAEGDQTVTYKYIKATNEAAKNSTVTTKYVDEKGQAIEGISDETQTGRVGDSYTTNARTIDGYALDSKNLPANAAGKFTEGSQTVIYKYIAAETEPVENGTVTVRYVDEQKQAIKDKDGKDMIVQIQGRTGDSYVTNAQAIDGYALDSDQLPANAKGTFTKDNQEVAYVYKKVEPVTVGNGQVTTKYIDEKTNQEIADQSIQKGRVEDTYATSAVDVKDYALDTDALPENANGKYETVGQIVIYKYKKVIAAETENGIVTVRYQDSNGKTLSPDQVVKGRVGDPYATSAPAITDYALSSQPANHQGTITKDAQTVTYIYNKVETPVPVNGKVTTIFKTADGKEIANSVTQAGRKGDSYTTSAITVPGYALDESQMPKNATGQFNDQDQTVTYIYKAAASEVIKNGDVQTVFVDGQGKAVADPVVQTGRIGDPYATSALNVAGYALNTDQLPQNGSGAFTAEKQTVTYVYKKAESQAAENGQVTTEYIDENNQEIAEPTILTGRVGDAYASNAINVAGYALDEESQPANAEGIYASVPQKVIYKYKKIMPNTVENGSITVNYQDENGKELAKSSQFTGRVNDAYTTNPIFIDGYSLVESKLPDNRSGKFTKENQVVTYVYKKAATDPIKNGTVQTMYVDENGKSISATTSVTGRVGDDFLANPIHVKGYLLDLQKLPKNQTSKFTDEKQTVTYVYKKVKALGKIDLPKVNRPLMIIPTKSTKQVSNDYSHTPSTLLPFSAKGISGIQSNRMFNTYRGNTPVSTNSVNNNYGKTYPKTNDQKSYILTAIGAGMLSLFAALMILKRRRKE